MNFGLAKLLMSKKPKYQVLWVGIIVQSKYGEIEDIFSNNNNNNKCFVKKERKKETFNEVHG